MLYLNYCTVRFLVNAIVASIWDLSANFFIIKYVLLPLLFEGKEDPSIVGSMFITMIPLLVLRIGIYYSIEKREIELFILNENY